MTRMAREKRNVLNRIMGRLQELPTDTLEYFDSFLGVISSGERNQFCMLTWREGDKPTVTVFVPKLGSRPPEEEVRGIMTAIISMLFKAGLTEQEMRDAVAAIMGKLVAHAFQQEWAKQLRDVSARVIREEMKKTLSQTSNRRNAA